MRIGSGDLNVTETLGAQAVQFGDIFCCGDQHNAAVLDVEKTESLLADRQYSVCCDLILLKTSGADYEESYAGLVVQGYREVAT